MVFSIKQHSQLPILKLKLVEDGRNDFDAFYEKLENAAVTFAMRDINTGRLQVANEPGLLLAKPGCSEAGVKQYYIGYQFSSEDTKVKGKFQGEFKLIFMDDSSELIAPIQEDLEIHVIDSFVRSEMG